MRRGLGVPVAAMAVPLAIAMITGCSVSVGKRVDADEVEKRISQALGPQLGGTPKSVTCPGALKGEKGVTMTCTLVTATGVQRTILVTVTGVEGDNVKFDMHTK